MSVVWKLGWFEDFFAISLKSISYSRKTNPLDGRCITRDLHFIYYNKQEILDPEGVLEKKFFNRDFGFCRHFRENCTYMPMIELNVSTY